MSDQNTNTIIISFLSFVVGALVGAVVTLLFAPMSGQEMRGRIREEAEASLDRAAAEWSKAQAEMRTMMEETRKEVKAYQAKALEDVKAQIEQLQTSLKGAEGSTK
jgi:gas vesicle protein